MGGATTVKPEPPIYEHLPLPGRFYAQIVRCSQATVCRLMALKRKCSITSSHKKFDIIAVYFQVTDISYLWASLDPHLPGRKFDCTYSGRYIQAQLYNIQLGREGERERGEEGMKEGEGGGGGRRVKESAKNGREREKEDITLL